MRIDACLITIGDKELGSLKNAVKSVLPYVDKVHITTNGKGVNKTKKWCEENGVDYSHLPWNKDFSEQRNFNFAQAKGADYIFWMDSDDILVGGEHLRDVADVAYRKNLDCIYVSYWYSCLFSDNKKDFEHVKDVDIVQPRERLINPRKMIWKKRLHETPVPIEGATFKHSNYPYDPKERPMLVLHTSCEWNEPKIDAYNRTVRNREILELELEGERKQGKPDPRTILYLMKIYAELKDVDLFNKCIYLGEEYLEMSGWDEERATCCLLMGRCYSYLNDWESAYKMYYQALQEYPGRTETFLRLSEASHALKKHREMKEWLDMAVVKDENKNTSSATYTYMDKLLSAEMTTRYFWDVKRNVRKAFKAAQIVYDLNPSPETEGRRDQLLYLNNLDIACEHADKLCQWLINEKHKDLVYPVISKLPDEIKLQPFSMNYIKQYKNPRTWEQNEICYFANFNGPSLQHWSPKSLNEGIGGSETAVISLAKQWSISGWKVTIYGDPGENIGENDGVNYLPWFYFNPRDKFNIFIQWRSNSLVNKINSKKFYVDLHDVTHPNDFIPVLDGIDKIFVKSQAHRKLLYGIPDEKIAIISNGIAI